MLNFTRTLLLALVVATPLRAAIDIRPVTSPQGFSAWLVEEHSIPFVAIELQFIGGASVESADKAGAVSMMTSLLSEGAGDMNAQGFAEALESLAAEVSFSSGRDSVTLSIRALTENRDAVIDLARLALTAPRFDPDSIEMVRGQQLATLERAARDPNAIAGRTFNALAYAGHPYAAPTDGTPETIAALTRDDILAAHRAAFTRDRVLVGASGDITADELGAVLDRLLGELPPAEVALPDYAEFTLGGGVTVVPHDGPQSVISFGHAGIPRDDPDFLPAFVMNEVFGGGRFGTRLMIELREQRGLTYGVGTSVASARFGDSFQGRFSTDNRTVGEAVNLVREQWQWLAAGGISQDDLDRIKTYLTGAYALRFEGNGSIAAILASMQLQGFDIDYVNVRNDLVEAVTLEDIHRISARMADPEALHFVIVGQPQGLD